jgi:hypothetical protein
VISGDRDCRHDRAWAECDPNEGGPLISRSARVQM